MAKTKQQKKNEIKPWKAFYRGTCTYCSGVIEEGQLVCRAPVTKNVIHFTCHEDWFPAPLKGSLAP